MTNEETLLIMMVVVSTVLSVAPMMFIILM